MHTMEDHAFVTIWREQEGITLKEMLGTESKISHISLICRILKMLISVEVDSRMVVTRGWGGGRERWFQKGHHQV